MRHLHILIALFSPIILVVAQSDAAISEKKLTIEEKSIEILFDSSSVSYDKGNYVASLLYNIEIVSRALATGNSKLIRKGYRFLAYDYLAINDTLLARESFEKSKNFAQKTKSNKAIGESFMDLGNLYSSAYEDYKTASTYYDKAIEAFKNEKDTLLLSKAYYNVIVNALDNDDYKEVSKYLYLLEEKSFYKTLDAAFKNNIELIWSDYYLYASEDYEKSNEYALKAIPFAKENEYYNILAEIYYNLGQGYYELKKYKEAADYNSLFIETEEINQERTRNAKTEVIAARFQVQEYQKSLEDAKEKAALQVQIANNKNILSKILIAVCLVGLLFFIQLYSAYKKRKVLNQALLQKNKEYLEAKEKSDLLSKAKSKFFSTVSHELRTPLYGVIGLSTILLENEKLKEHKSDLNSLKFSADYLLALINDVLQINKIDSETIDNKVSPFKLSRLIKRIKASFEYIRAQNNNIITVTIAPETPQYIIGNSVRLSQILMNLVGNACKFTEDGHIIIRVSPIQINEQKTTLLFSVKDNGIGIAKEKQESMFDEFTQIENLDYAYQGTGLGLPIVKKLLKQSSSEILLKSEIGKGSEFMFEIEFEIANKDQIQEEVEIPNIAALKGKNILVTEDNRINQIVTKKILENKGVVCTIVNNGEEAIETMKSSSFDLILMDLNMPITNGFEATLSIRKFNDDIPIIALTAVEVEEVRNEIYVAGMDDIIVKPYDTNKFITTILENLVGERKEKTKIIKKAI